MEYCTIGYDLEAMKEYVNACVEKPVKYQWGCKVYESELGKLPVGVTLLDCSGFVRSVMRSGWLTGQYFSFPDGSVDQHDWCQSVPLRPCSFEDNKLNDDLLRIGFIIPCADDGSKGHVWLMYNSMVWQCAAGTGVEITNMKTETYLGKACDAAYIIGQDAVDMIEHKIEQD